MRAVGIIAEYNPFHNGHAYQIRAAKELSGRPYVITAMSGDFVQRGEAAVFEKKVRAREALLGGVDMVIEIPAAFSVACAERFAGAGVRLLWATGLVDALCFGSECGQLEPLYKGLNENKSAIREGLERGASLAAARSPASLGPNDILGMEYLRAIGECRAAITPYTLSRRGARHDGPILEGGYASAGALRERLRKGQSIQDFTPSFAKALPPPRQTERLSSPILYALRRMEREEIAALPDVSEGLENSIYRACRSAADYICFLHLVKSKRYTLSRLRRIAMCALLGIAAKDTENYEGLYIRVLGLRESAKPLLGELGKRAALPLITGYSEAKRLSSAAARLHKISLSAGEIASLAGQDPPCFDYGAPLLMV